MRKIVILLIVGLVLGLGILAINNNNGQVRQENKAVQSPTVSPTFQTQTNSEGDVTVEVTPVSLSDKENVQFKIVLNTHSVPLDKDLKDTSILFDDQNNQYEPISWSGGTGGSPRLPAGEAGHHLEGILVFPPLLKNSKFVKLEISGIGSIRTFDWNL